MKRTARIGTALFVLLALACVSPEAWAGKVGREFRVNTYTAGDQTANDMDNSSVAALSNGGFVVTWHSLGQNGTGAGIYGQSYSAAGAPVGKQFRVNTTTANDHRDPSVTGLSDGGFVVTWDSNPQDGSSDGVYGRRYSSAGAPVSGEFRVNTFTDGSQYSPSVAGLNDGGFVVTWESYGQDGAGLGIYGQRYSAAGAPVGGEFRVNTHTKNDQFSPSVAALGDGGFVVTWNSGVQNGGTCAVVGQDGSGCGVYGQRYSAAGAPVGGEFRVNTHTKNDQRNPSVAGLSNGGFVVTWHSFGQNGSGWGVYGQRYDVTGAMVGSEFRVNIVYRTNNQWEPSVAGLSDGGFVVIYNSEGQDGDGPGIYGQRYSAAGARGGGTFRVNTYTASSQFAPSVAALSNGGFVVTWSSMGQDGSGWGVYGQRYAP